MDLRSFKYFPLNFEKKKSVLLRLQQFFLIFSQALVKFTVYNLALTSWKL